MNADSISRLRAYAGIGLACIAIFFGLREDEGFAYWPFINYSMFSHLSGHDDIVFLRMYAVIPGSRDEEIWFYRNHYLFPFGHYDLMKAYKRLMTNDPSLKRVKSVLSQIREHYFRRRRQGRVDGPEVRKLRLYSVKFKTFDYERSPEISSARLIVETE